MHEALFGDAGFGGGLSTLDLAKSLIDEGYHPLTMYFPLVVHGAMLIEPTETEDRKSVVLGKSVSVRVDLGGRRIIKKKSYRNRLSPTHYSTLLHSFCTYTYPST